jgi:hypothetical protein
MSMRAATPIAIIPSAITTATKIGTKSSKTIEPRWIDCGS